MASVLLNFEQILAKASSEAAGVAGGLAISETLRPELRFLVNAQNAGLAALNNDTLAFPIRPEIAALVAAENVDAYDAMKTQAANNGITGDRFKDLYGVSLSAPGTGELLQMLRRKTIAPEDFTHGLRKARLETRWDTAVADLQHVYLSPDILAVMLQRSVIPNQGQLPGVNLVTTGAVPRFPQVDIDAYAMAKTFGWSPAQLDAQARIQGLPPGMDLVARMVFRNILERGDFNLAAEQSNRRVEWADFEFEGYRQIPTAHDGVEDHLRGWVDAKGMYDTTARHGMSKADTDLLFRITGRPLSFHQVFIGERRGGTYDGPTDVIDPHFLKSLRESNIRPEWYNLAWAQRYVYPTAFVLRSLTEAHDISQQESETILLYEGWEPTLANKVSTKWYTTGAGAAKAAKIDPWLAKADNHLWTATQKRYIAGGVTPDQVRPALTLIGVDPTVQTEVFARWDEQRRIEAL